MVLLAKQVGVVRGVLGDWGVGHMTRLGGEVGVVRGDGWGRRQVRSRRALQVVVIIVVAGSDNGIGVIIGGALSDVA